MGIGDGGWGMNGDGGQWIVDGYGYR